VDLDKRKKQAALGGIVAVVQIIELASHLAFES
jgi:hypothetical protein